jgi:hypothetical protein
MWWVTQTGPGMVSPIFLCQLALELHMPVGELGNRMSAHELSVVWPTFFAWRERARRREEEKS